MSRRIGDYKALCFDVYGSLIDWRSGVYEALSPLLDRLDVPPSRVETLKAFMQAEAAEMEKIPDRRYSDLLSEVYRNLALRWSVPARQSDAERFAASPLIWPIFADALPALAHLKERYLLLALVNDDHANFDVVNVRMGRPWRRVYLASDAGCYKPDGNAFRYMLLQARRQHGLAPEDILYLGQSPERDLLSARRCGLDVCWIDRRDAPDPRPSGDFEPFEHVFADMEAFVERCKWEQGNRPAAE